MLGLIAHQHQLHSESAGGSVVTGHGKKNSVREFRMGTLREADGGIAIAKGRLDRGAEMSWIEELANIGFGEMERGHSMGFGAVSFYRK
jgi:hypothetical protein